MALRLRAQSPPPNPGPENNGSAIQNIDLSNLDMEAVEDAPRVEGEDSQPIVFIFSGGPPNLKEAVDRAIESGRGTALSDVTIYFTSWYVPFIVGENKFTVQGKVVP